MKKIATFLLLLAILPLYRWLVVIDCGRLGQGQVCSRTLYTWAEVQQTIKEQGKDKVLQVYYLRNIYNREIENE
jgi:hypothetical protein